MLKNLNFFFLSFSKKENLALFKNIFIALITGKSLHSQYTKLHINQIFNNLSYAFSITKSHYSIETFYLIQKIFILINYTNLFISAGNLTHNSFFSYLTVKNDVFTEQFLIHDGKFVLQKTYLTQKVYWFTLRQYNFSEQLYLSLSSLFIFDLLNLCSIPYYGLFIEKNQINKVLSLPQ